METAWYYELAFRVLEIRAYEMSDELRRVILCSVPALNRKKSSPFFAAGLLKAHYHVMYLYGDRS
jgi:hypothetical protein